MEGKTIGILSVLIASLLGVIFIPVMMSSVLDTRGSCNNVSIPYYSVENDQCQVDATNTTFTKEPTGGVTAGQLTLLKIVVVMVALGILIGITGTLIKK